MEPGKELDAKVAEKVMGWHHDTEPSAPFCSWWFDNPELKGTPMTLPCYSTDIAAAWSLWRKLAERFFYWEISFTKALKCRAKLYRSAKAMQFGDPSFEAVGETGMHAICLVALKAVGVEVEDEARQGT